MLESEQKGGRKRRKKGRKETRRKGEKEEEREEGRTLTRKRLMNLSLTKQAQECQTQ